MLSPVLAERGLLGSLTPQSGARGAALIQACLGSAGWVLLQLLTSNYDLFCE